MKAILIYGPPASGKLTIAKEICKATTFKLFHNHAVIDLCFSVLDSKSPRSWSIIQKIRLDIVREAVKQNVPGIVMTMAYTGERDYIRRLIRVVENNQGRVYLVRLTCDPAILRKRVKNISRQSHGKLHSQEGLEEWLVRHRGGGIISGGKNLVLDTSRPTSKQSAKKVLEYI